MIFTLFFVLLLAFPALIFLVSSFVSLYFFFSLSERKKRRIAKCDVKTAARIVEYKKHVGYTVGNQPFDITYQPMYECMIDSYPKLIAGGTGFAGILNPVGSTVALYYSSNNNEDIYVPQEEVGTVYIVLCLVFGLIFFALTVFCLSAVSRVITLIVM